MPLELEITGQDGERRVVVLDLVELEQRFEIEQAEEPLSVTLDPRLKVLAHTSLERR